MAYNSRDPIVADRFSDLSELAFRSASDRSAQDDAQEFFLTLVNQIFPKSSPFTFQLQTVVTCQECNRNATLPPEKLPSLMVSLDVGNGNLRDLINADEHREFTFENCRHTCEQAPTKTQFVGSPPAVLAIQLKRFKFDKVAIWPDSHLIGHTRWHHLCKSNRRQHSPGWRRLHRSIGEAFHGGVQEKTR